MKRYVIANRPWDRSSATPEVRQSYVDAHDAFQRYVDLITVEGCHPR